MDAVEFQQMRRGHGAAFHLIHMDYIEPVSRPWILYAAIDTAYGGAQRETADAAHAVDADAHDQRLPTDTGKLPPASSSRFSVML